MYARITSEWSFTGRRGVYLSGNVSSTGQKGSEGSPCGGGLEIAVSAGYASVVGRRWHYSKLGRTNFQWILEMKSMLNIVLLPTRALTVRL
jgi:hypothetical protein